jgi:hypothetical protein
MVSMIVIVLIVMLMEVVKVCVCVRGMTRRRAVTRHVNGVLDAAAGSTVAE